MALWNGQPDQLRRIAEILNYDRRPTFVLDLQSPCVRGTSRLDILFCNAAITRRPRLEARLLGMDRYVQIPCTEGTIPYQEFAGWVTAAKEAHCQVDLGTTAVFFWGLQWDFYTLEHRWRIVSASARDHFAPNLEHASGNSSPERPDNREKTLNSPLTQDATATTFTTPFGMFGPDIREYSKHIGFMRDLDWTSTTLGPMSIWPNQLRQMCNITIADPDPALLFWGAEFVTIYNEAAIPILGHRHPQVMGQKCADSFAEVWSEFGPIFNGVARTGKTCKRQNVPVYMNRNGRVEEHFFTYTYLPVIGEEDEIVGIYERALEVTSEKIAQRRATILRRMSNNASEVTELEGFWRAILKTIDDDGLDVPVALLYSVSDSIVSGKSDEIQCGALIYTLEYFVGTSHSEVDCISILQLDTDATGISELLRNAMESMEPVCSRISFSRSAQSLFQGVPGRGFGEPSSDVVVCPIRPTQCEGVVACLVLGLNPRKSFDIDYQNFVRAMQSILSTAAASILLLTEERNRGRTIAEQATNEKAQLSAQVASWIEEAGKQEKKFKEFVRHAPVGVAMTKTDGSVYFANDVFYELTDYDRNGSHEPNAWESLIYPEDLERMKKYWETLRVEKLPFSIEVRVKRPWTPPGNSEEQRFSWLLVSNYVEHRNGIIETVVTCVTDINNQKWAETIQFQRGNDAVTAKQKQDEFIDMTSHEMRNPLSAVLQCAEEIVGCITECFISKNDYQNSAIVSERTLRTVLDAAETVYYCTQHQQRIVDDILTMSKLSSGHLSFHPSPVQPLAVIEEATRFYSREMSAADIQFSLKCDVSLKSNEIDWLMLDRGRLTQIFLNFLSNAIKFTKPEARRWIKVQVYVFLKEPPFVHDRDIPYMAREEPTQDPTHGAEWGADEQVFLEVTIEDSGPGLDEAESKNLFQRFFQVAQRTHIQYGGSGLGLYICRKLTEMHGGRLGFTSEPGHGSLFAFYLKCRRAAQSANRNIQLVQIPSPPRAIFKTTSHESSYSDSEPASPASPVANVTPEPVNGDCDQHDVLIVEDNITNQRVLARQLQRLGHRVSVANHGKEGLDHVSKTQFWNTNVPNAEKLPLTIVFCDIEMPIMDGIQFVSKLRELQRDGTVRPHVPVIAITGNAREEQVARAKDAGMDEVVLKPFKISTLTRIMADWCPSPSQL